MFKVAIGHSEQIDSADAAAEIFEQCDEKLGGEKPCAGVLFAAISHEHRLILDKILEKYPGIELIGCSSDGEMSTSGCFSEDSMILTLFVSDDVEIKAGCARDIANDPHKAAFDAVNEARGKLSKPPALCIALPESLTANLGVILEGVKKALGREFPIFGGGSSEPGRFERTFQFFGREILRDAIPLLLFSSPVIHSFAISSGWKPIGQAKKITRSKANVVYEIGDEPAVKFYERYFGGDATVIGGEFPMIVRDTEDSKSYIRAALRIDKKEGAVTYGGDIAEGSIVQLGEASRDDLLVSAGDALEKALSCYPGKDPVMLFAFSCGARKALLGTRTCEEFSFIREKVPKSCAIAGFYTYGELSPIDGTKETKFHNATVVTLLLGVK
ncbi:MAG TPA: FIST N-terminal domain-containing protein [Candidatus Wallbacteria bacterium]|nr:FIST N-terminal domain-containing protein [Candidatus Wallbacteria bacterium]